MTDTPALIAELKALLEKATPGHLVWDDDEGTLCIGTVGQGREHGCVGNMWNATDATEADAAFMVAAVNALPRLLAIVEAAERLREAFQKHMHVGTSCHTCNALAAYDAATGRNAT